MPLEEYQKKRDFTKTPEPSSEEGSLSEDPIFVVQEHHATHLHWDFRLEIEGMLKSWAVPKGPSLVPRTKRLAVLTEDHPLDYAGFEDIIPEDEYGGGTVLIWDRGTYEVQGEKPPAQQLAQGLLRIVLKGQKLQGGFALVKLKRAEENAWLLIKERDKYAREEGEIITEQPRSVVSRRTCQEMHDQQPKDSPA